MRKISRKGIQGGTFGVMEGTIMMLGVLLGLSVTGNRFIVVLGLLTAGIADAFANAAGFYVSEESEMIHTKKEAFKAARLCFLGTLLTVAVIVLPLLAVKNLKAAITLSFIVGIVILFLFGRYMAKKLKSKNPAKTISKYLLIGLITAFVCYLIGAFLQYLALVS